MAASWRGPQETSGAPGLDIAAGAHRPFVGLEQPFVGISVTVHCTDVIKTRMKNAETGFTLVELLIALLIGAILATLAAPSFMDTIRRNRLVSASNDFLATLNYARSEAIKRGQTITVCASSDQATCTNSPWQDGWIVQEANSTELLRAHGALDGEATLTRTDASTMFQYTPRGLLAGGNSATFNLCVASGFEGRQIVISATGRARIVEYNGC